MATWMQEFKALQTPAVRGAPSKRLPPSKAEQIEAELKLLEWHRLANNAAIKASMLKTKSLRQGEDKTSANSSAIDAHRARKIAESELSKPLQLTRDVKLGIERQEKENSEKLSVQVDRHISTLKRLRTRLEERAQVKSRHDEFKDWKRSFAARKEAILGGVLPREGGDNQQGAEEGGEERGGRAQELSTVLESLNKLSELENRILGLEGENRLNDPRTENVDAALSRGALGPVAVQRRAFLTESSPQPDKSKARERQLQLARATNGQRELRARVMAKTSRSKEAVLGNRRHEMAMRELQKRKTVGLPPVRSNANNATKSAPLREFNSLKQGYQKRKEDFYKKLNTRQPVARAPVRALFGTAPSRPAEDRNHRSDMAAELKRVRLGIAARTAPAGVLVRRVLARPVGTVTRRVDGSPVRRPAWGEEPPRLLPLIAGVKRSVRK